MKKNIFMGMLGGLLLCYACSDDFSSTPELNDTQIKHSIPTRSLDQALAQMEQMLSAGDTGITTRTGSERIVSHVETVTSGGATRSADSDTLLYLVNFQDGGFAVLGTPEESNLLYAFSDTGSISLNDTILNPSMGLFLHDAIEDASAATMLSTDSDPGVIGGGTIDVKYWLKRKADPMLPTRVAGWHQESPYNEYAPITQRTRTVFVTTPSGNTSSTILYYNGKGVVGCVPLSVGSLLAYYKWPLSLPQRSTSGGGYPLNWGEMVNGLNATMCAFMLEYIADPSMLNAYYKNTDGFYPTGAEGEILNGDLRYAYLSNCKRTLEALGYDTSNAFHSADFSNATVREEILTFMTGRYATETTPKAPLLVSSSLYNTDMVYQGSHAWVVDGFAEYIKSIEVLPGVEYPTQLYLHCIWGNKSTDCNGYYLYIENDQKLDSQTKEGVKLNLHAKDLRMYGRYGLNK